MLGQCDTTEVELWGECYPTYTTNISLIGQGLTGEIPPEIGQITGLIVLKLSNNQLTGSIPSEIGNLTGLKKLELRFNNLSGNIPSEIWSLSELEILYLEKNQLTGSIPPEIGNLTNLTHLYLFGNQLTGSIPAEIGNLTDIVRLHINNNQFTGNIPETICSLNRMHWYNPHIFDISGNQLLPPYPVCIEPFVGYQYSEDCESNYLFNGVCVQQSDLDVLQIFIDNSSETINMEMDDNVNGQIEPIELGTQYWKSGKITELNCNYDLANALSIGDLGISGQIPAEIGTLDSLEILWLEDNQLTGPIPPEIGNLEELMYLILHHNQISGSIPNEIGNLANLEILKLDNNQLTGHIPESICDLDIAFNWQNDLFGENFAVYNNQLCPPYPDCVEEYVGIQNCFLGSTLSNQIPQEYELNDAYPNPFNANTTIGISLPQKEIVSLKVYDISGRELKTIAKDIFIAGKHKINWYADNLSSGTYFIRMESRHFSDTKKVCIIK